MEYNYHVNLGSVITLSVVRRITEIPPKHLNTPISWLFNSDFWQMHDRFVCFRVTLTQYAFVLTFMVSLNIVTENKHADDIGC